MNLSVYGWLLPCNCLSFPACIFGSKPIERPRPKSIKDQRHATRAASFHLLVAKPDRVDNTLRLRPTGCRNASSVGAAGGRAAHQGEKRRGHPQHYSSSKRITFS